MFDVYNPEYSRLLKQLSKACQDAEEATKALKRFHSINGEADTADLTGVFCGIEDLQDLHTDEVVPLIQKHDKLDGKYQTYNSTDIANENRHSYQDMGLKTGRS